MAASGAHPLSLALGGGSGRWTGPAAGLRAPSGLPPLRAAHGAQRLMSTPASGRLIPPKRAKHTSATRLTPPKHRLRLPNSSLAISNRGECPTPLCTVVVGCHRAAPGGYNQKVNAFSAVSALQARLKQLAAFPLLRTLGAMAPEALFGGSGGA
eukprot:15480154-Alexandrium_andersonii.AAC.1